MKRAWQAYLLFDWKVGEALGGVLRRFTTFWLAQFVVAALRAVVSGAAWSTLVASVLWLAVLLWMYQPTKIYRSKRYAGWSVPPPSGATIRQS